MTPSDDRDATETLSATLAETPIGSATTGAAPPQRAGAVLRAWDDS